MSNKQDKQFNGNFPLLYFIIFNHIIAMLQQQRSIRNNTLITLLILTFVFWATVNWSQLLFLEALYIKNLAPKINDGLNATRKLVLFR